MLESLLHMIGICPDHFAHIDLMDYLAFNWTQVTDAIKYIRARFAI